MTTILIADDEAVARRMLANTLKRAGFEVVQACNGRDAWEQLQQMTPDAMITDVDMPKMTGQELCAQICDQMPERDWPIIVVTSKTALEHRSWSQQMNDVSFVEKPYSMRRLVDHLQAELTRARGEGVQ